MRSMVEGAFNSSSMKAPQKNLGNSRGLRQALAILQSTTDKR